MCYNTQPDNPRSSKLFEIKHIYVMKYIIAIALSVAVLGGCSRSGDDEVAAREAQDAKIARLEKEVSRLRSEVRELRRRMDTAP